MNGNGALEPEPREPEVVPGAGGPGLVHRRRFPNLRRRHGALLGGLALAVVVGLVGVTLVAPGAGPGTTATPLTAQASASPQPTAAVSPAPSGPPPTSSPQVTPSPSPGPTPTPTEWAAAVLPAIEPVADLVATRTDQAGTSIDTAFTLTSRAGADALELAKGIQVTPRVELALSAGATADIAVLRPKAALAPGTAYRVTLRLPDSSLAGSWVFQTGKPPHVVGTLPADEADDVPVDTGIEITFDQDGVADIAPFFTISPKVGGRFERHGRTQVFVPAVALKPLTVYTVTVRRGIPLDGSDLVMEKTVAARFETAPKPGQTPKAEPDVSAALDLVEVRTAAAPVLELAADKGVSRVGFRVYRFATVQKAVDAYLAFKGAPDWAGHSDAGLVPTAGLTQVARFSATFHRWQSGWGAGWVRFPARLAAGWYLAVIPRTGRDVQVFLQVTDVATTIIVASGQTMVWAHDLATGGPLAGATVATIDGTAIGRTDADGLMLQATPASLLGADLVTSPRAGVLLVRAAGGTAAVPGRATFVPVGAWNAEQPYEDQFWRLLFTDRTLFRQSDTIEAWGLLRPRGTGPAPAAELRLTAGCCGDEEPGDTAVAVARATVDLDPQTGVFAVSIPVAGVPAGQYQLGLWIGEHQVASTTLDVGVIRKPAYRLDVVTDRRVLVVGDKLTTTVSASFFDGTRAPGLRVRAGLDWFEGDEPSSSGSATTGADGTAKVVLRPLDTWDQWDWRAVTARPSGPEEAEISASTDVLVFASRVVLDGEATLKARLLTVTGSLHAVDLARLEREQRAGYTGELRPQGAPAAGSRVTATVDEEWDVCTRTGRVYDFITKKAVDTFECEQRERTLGSWQAVTSTSGSFTFKVPVPAAGHSYRITLAAADANGRKTSLWLDASQVQPVSGETGIVLPTFPTLSLDAPADAVSWDDTSGEYAVGDQVRATVRSGGAAMPTGGKNRYLFFVARPGSLEAHVQGSPTFVRPFAEADVPAVSIGAAWFDGSAGALAEVGQPDTCGPSGLTVEARLDPASRAITVSLGADAAKYAPGGRATLAVRTKDAAGKPVAATVVLRAIDEKLYTISAAQENDVAGELYAAPDSGIVAELASHPLPVYREQGGCDTGGGDGDGYREDFRDSLLFRRVTTGADGRATVSFDLSDDLTSWRISAAAIGSRQGVGQATLLVPVGLPLFIEAPLAPDYLVGERPVLRVRAYGDALKVGDRVTFTVSAPSLGMGATTVVGRAFTALAFPLPALSAGDHEIRISASAGSGAAAASDRLLRTIHVVGTRFTERRTAYADLADGLPSAGGDAFVTFVFADAGRGRFVAPLEELVAGFGSRVDQALAAAMARDILVASFGVDPASLDSPTFDPARYQVEPAEDSEQEGNGIALLPYASADLALSARVALVAGDRFDVDALRAYFDWQLWQENATRERRNIALAGLAALGDPVLADIRAALAVGDLTIRERLYLALGAAALGDHATALEVERDVLGRYGQRLGPWLRLRVGTSLDDTIEATALVALIGAATGDPAAEWAEAYVEDNRAVDDLFNLQEVGYVARVLERTPAEAARFTYSLAGTERTVDIAAGEAFSLTLTPAQAAALSARPVAGRVGVVVSWDAPVDPATLVQDPALTLTRTVSPTGVIPSTKIVRVTLSATFGPQAIDDCYTVVDILPSGLAPFDEQGQRVTFCLEPGKRRVDSVTYRARVVTPGTYTWEPAIIQSTRAPESLALTPARQVVIR